MAIPSKRLILCIVIFLKLLKISNSQTPVKSQFDLFSPIVITDYYSTASSLFGWTVSLVKINRGHSSSSWIFIGDPKGNSTDPSYTSTTFQPGVVWRCSLGRSGISDTCKIMNLDPQNGVCNYQSCQDFPSMQYKSDSFVGASLMSNSKRFVTCGPRWRRGRSDNPYMNGVCYWFPKDQMYSSWTPERNDLNIDTARFNHRLIPLFERENPYIRSHQSFNLPNNEGSVYDWGLGEFGMSIHLGESQNNMQELVVGAPGVRLYSGAVIIYSESGKPFNGQSRANKGRDIEYAYFNMVNREAPDVGQHYYDYFGYAVTSGKYFGEGEVFYAGGSPRARGGEIISGEVVIFRIPSSTAYISRPVQILEGGKDAFASYFGAALLSIDTNLDGSDELFVGAPLCSNSKWDSNIKLTSDESTPLQQGKVSSNGVGDQGCVFVYSRSFFKNELESQTQIFGSGAPGARFGSTMVSLGDINEDNCPDFAIGAPYEENEQGQGAVYIFYGVKDKIPSNWVWMERITPSSLGMTIKFPMQGFGSSLSTGQDIDENGTPDLAIGSFLTKNVVILRTRPMIKLSGQITFLHPTVDTKINSVPYNVSSFRIKSCGQYSGILASPTLPLRVTLALDRNLERFTFSDTATYDQEFRNGVESCKTLQVKLTKRLDSDASPTVAPISVEQSIEYKGDTNFGRGGQMQQFNIKSGGNGREPVLEKGNSISMDSFCPKCPFPAQIQNEHYLDIAPECRNPNRCVPNLKLQMEFLADGEIVKSAVIDWTKRYSVYLSITNAGEPAYSPEITFTWKSDPSDADFPTIPFLPAGCKDGTSIGSYICTRSSIKSENPIELPFEFTMNGVYGKRESQMLGVEVIVKSRDYSRSQVASLILTSEARIKIDGSKTKSGTPLEDRFTQSYTIILSGKTPMEIISADFKFPTWYKVDGSDRNIILISKPKENIECQTEGGDFTKLPDEPKKTKIISDGKPKGEGQVPATEEVIISSRRRRRQVKETRRDDENQIGKSGITPGGKFSDAQSGHENVTILRCADKEAKCMSIRCTLKKVIPGSMPRISFEMLMVPENTVKLLGDKDTLLVQSEGSVKILSGDKPRQSGQTFSQSAVLKFQNVVEGEEIPPWVYFVSGIGGLILLFLIIIGLRATGFFRRKTKEELDQLKAQAEVQDHMQAANNVPNFDNLGDDQHLQ